MDYARPSLLTLLQLSKALRLPAQWLKAEADAGRIPCLRVGRHIRFNESAVEIALAERAACEKAVAP